MDIHLRSLHLHLHYSNVTDDKRLRKWKLGFTRVALITLLLQEYPQSSSQMMIFW